MPKPPEKPRPWLCRNGHILGHVERDRKGIKLVFYDSSIDLRWPQHDTMPVIRGFLCGEGSVRCTVCRAERSWEPNAETMDRFMARREERKAADKCRTSVLDMKAVPGG